MFNIPIPNFLKPYKYEVKVPGAKQLIPIPLPEFNPLRYPMQGVVFNTWEISSSNCSTKIQKKTYSILGYLVHVDAPIIIHNFWNKACNRPPKNFNDRDGTIAEPIVVQGLYTTWLMKQQHYTWKNSKFVIENASWELVVQSINIEYRDGYPGNAVNGKNYDCGYYLLKDGGRSNEIYTVAGTPSYVTPTYAGTIWDARIEDEPNRRYRYSGEPVRRPRKGWASYRVDIYGNFISDAPENKPIYRNEWGYFERYLEEDEIVPPFIVVLPKTQKGLQITYEFSAHQSLKFNKRAGEERKGKSKSSGDSFTYTWHVYKRPIHDIEASSNYGLVNLEQPDVYGGVLLLARHNTYNRHWAYGENGYELYQLVIPGQWLQARLTAATLWSNNGTFGVQSYEWKNVDNALTAYWAIGACWVTQNLQRTIDVPYSTLPLPVYSSSQSSRFQGWQYYSMWSQGIDNGWGENYGNSLDTFKTWYEIDNEMPPMNEQCCEDIKKLLKIVLKQQGNFPARVPDLFTKQNPQMIKKESLLEVLLWQTKQLDALLGNYPIKVEIEDSDLTQAGNQGKKIELPNIAETLAEILGLLLVMQTESSANLDISFKALAEAGQAKKAATIASEFSGANAEFLGYKLEQKKKKMKMLFDPTKEKLDEALVPTEMEYIGYENTDRSDFNDYLRRLLEAAAIIKAVHFVKVKDAGDLYRRMGIDVAALENKFDENKQEDFDVFTEQAEQGFTNVAGSSTPPETPYGRPWEQRPKIKEIGQNKTSEGGKKG